jgi:hypothetical protein
MIVVAIPVLLRFFIAPIKNSLNNFKVLEKDF